MLKILQKIFYSPDKETITIFEEKTKIDYSPTLFSSLEVLSLTNSRLNNLTPISVFLNLKVLNLSNNKIQNISCLNNLKKLRIIDLRFNEIKELPLWVFKLGKILYWERTNEEQEGIYLEGNPLNKKLISKIKSYPIRDRLLVPIIQKKEKDSLENIQTEALQPLNRQQVTLFFPQSSSSSFLNSFIIFNKKPTIKKLFKLNISLREYNNNYEISNSNEALKYIILIIKETECCLNPPILESISKLYIKSQIFLIIESSDNKNIQKKITFFKTYNKSLNIIKIYHSSSPKNNNLIEEEIYDYLENTQEVNTLWKENWIALRDEIEENNHLEVNEKTFQSLADKHLLPQELRSDIYSYLKKVGSIKLSTLPLQNSTLALPSQS